MNCICLKLSHDNLAYDMIILFINIKLLMINNYLSKGFPGQRHEALYKCLGMELRTIRTLDNSDLGQFRPDSDLSCGQFGP